MDARALLAVGMAAAWSAANTIEGPDGRRPSGLVFIAFQLATWIAACAVLPNAPVILYGKLVAGVWTMLILATEIVFKSSAVRSQLRRAERDAHTTLVMDVCLFQPSAAAAAQHETPGAPAAPEQTPMLVDAEAHKVLEYDDTRRDCAMICDNAWDAVSHDPLKDQPIEGDGDGDADGATDPSSSPSPPRPPPRVYTPDIRLLLHISWFASLIAWAVASTAWYTLTPVGSAARIYTMTAALVVGATNWWVRADMNVETEQIDVVHDACCGCGDTLTSVSAALRISALQIFAMCMCTIADGVAAWGGDAGAVVAYCATVIVLPWITSVFARSGSLQAARTHGALVRLQIVSSAWVEQHALCQGAWWTWVFLVQLVGWEPTLVPTGALAPDADAASAAFASFALVMFFVSLAFYAEAHELMISCLRGNRTSASLHRVAERERDAQLRLLPQQQPKSRVSPTPAPATASAPQPLPVQSTGIRPRLLRTLTRS